LRLPTTNVKSACEGIGVGERERVMKIDKQRLIFGLYLLVLIAIAEIVMGQLKLPAWPAFLAMIFFFVEHMDVKKVRHIVVGGAFGIGLILTATPIIGALAPMMGVELARLAFILGLVFAIILFGEALPMLFNNYAFMSLTVTGIAVQLPNPNPIVWMLIALIGGAALIGGVVGIGKLMASTAGKPDVAPAE
jgi:hypothetical protein